jgi:hypothetical protein
MLDAGRQITPDAEEQSMEKAILDVPELRGMRNLKVSEAGQYIGFAEAKFVGHAFAAPSPSIPCSRDLLNLIRITCISL